MRVNHFKGGTGRLARKGGVGRGAMVSAGVCPSQDARAVTGTGRDTSIDRSGPDLTANRRHEKRESVPTRYFGFFQGATHALPMRYPRCKRAFELL